MNEELLITLVSNYEELYDPKHPKYENSYRRTLVWEEIGAELNVAGDQCKERWKRLRDNYRRAKKLRKTKASLAIKKIKYEDVISFINPFMESFGDAESNEALNTEFINEAGEVEDDGSVADGWEEPSQSSMPRQTISVSPKRQKVVHLSQNNSSDIVETLLANQYDDSARIVNFFRNMGETVSTFPEAMQIRIKREVFTVVNQVEESLLQSREYQN